MAVCRDGSVVELHQRASTAEITMAHNESVRILSSLFRASNQARPVLLLGAGASFSSGVPLAAESVKRLARRVYAEKVRGGSLLPEQVKLSEWQTWLHGQPWFIHGDDRLSENFPLAVRHLLTPREYRRRLLLELVHPANGTGPGYKRLAEFVMRGLVRTLLTTNFDICLPEALNEKRPHIKHVAEVNRSPNDLREFDIFSRAQIVWLHGKAEQYTDRNLVEEVNELDAKLVNLIVPLLASSPLVVIGYRGAEPSIVDCLLTKNVEQTHQYRNGIYWCFRSGELLHPNVEALRRAVGSNFRALDIAGFDELMESLSTELVGEDLYPTVIAAGTPQGVPAFDDRPVPNSSLDEIDQDLLMAVMQEYCSKLGRAPVTRETLPALLREQGLLVSANGQEVPTAGCILLFGKEPQKRFPHAVVSATECGKKRVIFEGNLIRQRNELLEWLGSVDINPVLKVKQHATHDERTAYPARALVELIVNMLVHRDYDVQEPALIDVEPGVSITFKNPGGLPDSIASRITVDHEGCFRPIPHISDLRNRSLCDVFFGIRAMERAGTGLSDVEEMAREYGGDAIFKHEGSANRFIARVYQPAASAGSKTVARDGRPIGVYVVNALPFVSLPELVSVVPLTVSLWARPSDVSIKNLGTFVLHDEKLWSFTPLHVLESVLVPIVRPSGGRVIKRQEMEKDNDHRKILSWLIRKHFERHLSRFEGQGLILDLSKRHIKRAYFVGREGKPRTLTYGTAKRKRINRQVVKQRAEGAKAWFENEGFGYEVIQLDGRWAVRIKPFYMFTGRDAHKPLPSFTRAARATRRMKFDRNKSVDGDLTFWSRFLRQDSPTINIGDEHVNDLVLNGSFLTIEVAEEGMLRDSDENKDRMSA